MPKLKSHPRVIEAAEAIAGQRTKYSIDGVIGLLLECYPDGGRAWFVRYQVGHGRNGRTERYHRLGSFARGSADYLTFGQAKDAANNFRAEAKKGQDPFAAARVAEAKKERDKAEGLRTYDVCFSEWLVYSGRRRALSPRTREEYQGLHKRHVSPLIGGRPVTTLQREQVDRALRSIYEETNSAHRGQRGLQATKAYQNIRSVLEWCVNEGHIPLNPARRPSWLPSKDNPNGKQSRAPTDQELRQLWLEGPREMTPAQWQVMSLAILLGRRVSEIAGAQRNDVHLDSDPPFLVIPANREGNKAKSEDKVPLPPIAASIVRAALKAGSDSSPLFVGATTRWTTSKAFMLVRRRWGWPGRVRLHDARTLINDQLARLGVPTEIRSRTLHHTGDLKQLANTVYSSFDHLPQRYRALRLWELRLRDITKGRTRTLRWSP